MCIYMHIYTYIYIYIYIYIYTAVVAPFPAAMWRAVTPARVFAVTSASL